MNRTIELCHYLLHNEALFITQSSSLDKHTQIATAHTHTHTHTHTHIHSYGFSQYEAKTMQEKEGETHNQLQTIINV